MKFSLRGDWRPGSTNPALLAAQLIVLVQAAFRGLDYLHQTPGEPRSALSVVEHAAALPVWGWLFYGSTILVLIGLAARRATPIVLGHALLFAWYWGIGLPVLGATAGPLPVDGWAGLVVAAAGTWALVTRRISSIALRVCVAVPFMICGQWLLADGLGSDYRTGTGLVATGLLHVAFALGTTLTASRQQFAYVVEQEHSTTGGEPSP